MKTRHVTETGLTFMFLAYVPLSLWVQALSTATFLKNWLPSPNLGGKTSYELLYGKQLHYSILRTYGCLFFPYLSDYGPHKLSPKSTPRVFLGYSTLQKSFHCLDPKTHQVYISRYRQFHETCFPNSDSYTQFRESMGCDFPLSSCF